MSQIDVSPVYWTSEMLAEQGNDVIHALALRCVGTQTSYLLLAGRCLIAGESSGLFEEYGCSGDSHYATVHLGLGEREAREARRVAAKLEGLPLLRRAAEEGEIGWSKLREVVRKADLITERYWLELCRHRTYAEIEELVGSTRPGGLPDYSSRGEPTDRLMCKTELRCALSPQTMTIVQRGLDALSQDQGRRVSMQEALEILFGQLLSRGTLDDKTLDGLRSEAGKDLQAAEDRRDRWIREARDFARQMGYLALEGGAETPVGANPVTTDLAAAGIIPIAEAIASASDGTSQLNGNGPRPVRVTRENDTAAIEATSIPVDGKDSPSKDDETAQAWMATTAVNLEVCPTDERLRIAMRGQPTWRNQKLSYNENARGLTPAQRKDLLRRDGYCCNAPGCPNKLWLHAHHLQAYSRSGATAPYNVLFLCPRCHKNVHEGHLFISGSPEDGSLEFRDAQGRKLGVSSRPGRALWLDSRLGWYGDSETDSRALQLFLEDGESFSAETLNHLEPQGIS